MNIQNLQEKYPKLIFEMKENGYSGLYISRIESEIRHIIRQAGAKGWKSYTDVYFEYAKISKSPAYLSMKRTVLGLIENYETYEINPGSRAIHKIARKTSYDSLTGEFKSLIDHYKKVEKCNGKKASTIYTESHNATTFLLALQQKGMNTLEKITENGVLEIFTNQQGHPSHGYSCKKSISVILKVGISFFPEHICERILSYLPTLREKRKNIEYLTNKEISRIKFVLTEKESSLSLRDKAIGLLALYTGLRSCDIAGLSMNNIDWSNDLIKIRQQKTNVPLELPLTAIVGNAIYDYLTLERPQNNLPEIFLTQTHPYKKLKSQSLFNVAKKIMSVAQIREEVGSRKGFHLFRHYVATALLGNGIPQPIISSTLGHTSPASLNTYLSADFSHLKECALNVEHFPLRKEVLN